MDAAERAHPNHLVNRICRLIAPGVRWAGELNLLDNMLLEAEQAARQDERRKVLEEVEGSISLATPEDGILWEGECWREQCHSFEYGKKRAIDCVRALAEEVTRGNVKWVTRDELAEMYPDPDERKR